MNLRVFSSAWPAATPVFFVVSSYPFGFAIYDFPFTIGLHSGVRLSSASSGSCLISRCLYLEWVARWSVGELRIEDRGPRTEDGAAVGRVKRRVDSRGLRFRNAGGTPARRKGKMPSPRGAARLSCRQPAKALNALERAVGPAPPYTGPKRKEASHLSVPFSR